MKKFLITISLILFFFNSGCEIYKRSDIKDNPTDVNERVKRNIEEGKGLKFLKKNKNSGTFDFASSNELWRASLDVLDFVTFINASYSGGILITDWFNTGPKNKTLDGTSLKITVRFLSNDIRADAIKVNIHERTCLDNSNSSCSVIKINSILEDEIKLAILKKATILVKNDRRKKRKEFKESGKILKVTPTGEQK